MNNRIIKFRVWDGKKFYNSITLFDLLDGYPLDDCTCFSKDLIFQEF
ncbi:MAG: hypothetical protein AABY22_24080 [Nanoarchaeota archaeon]